LGLSDFFQFFFNLVFGLFIAVNPLKIEIKKIPTKPKPPSPDPIIIDPIGPPPESPNDKGDSDGEEEKFSQSYQKLLVGHFKSVGSAERQGRRKTMEDRSDVHINLYQDSIHFYDYLAVFDGHGETPSAAIYLQEHLHQNFVRAFKEQASRNQEIDVHETLNKVFVDTSVDMAPLAEYYGSTACVVIVVDSKVIYTANAGDTRAIWIENLRNPSARKIKRLSTDHRPTDAKEAERVKNAGGKIINGKLRNLLAVTRSFGDSAMNPFGLTAIPSISQVELDVSHDNALVIACDGIWDHLTEEEVAEVVARNATNGLVASEQVRDLAYSKKSKDNLSALVAYF